MPNPYLPAWEYIPDGEPRLFGNRIYVYGSHDRVDSEDFCDFKLKVWSCDKSDLSNWTCHGVSFKTRGGEEVDWTRNELYAPDVVEKDGKYYLFAYILNAPGCVAVSDNPEGPFCLLGKYDATAQLKDLKEHPEKYLADPDAPDDFLIDGRPEENGTQAEIAIRDMESATMIDPGVLVDDDGHVYVYCGFLHSYMFEVDPHDMRTVICGTYRKDIIPKNWSDGSFFEACSPRKINGRYYLIYSPRKGSRLAYAVSDSPYGPFEYMGYIVDNSDSYPGGNDHGSVCCVDNKWYIFYHKMTNNTCMSRRGCIEEIKLLPDGTFTYAEMTSGGAGGTLNPYEITPAEYACVLKGGCFVAEENIFERNIYGIKNGALVGFKYFDFGTDYSGTEMKVFMSFTGLGQTGKVSVRLDTEDGNEIGSAVTPLGDGITEIPVKCVTGIHAIFFIFETGRTGWLKDNFNSRDICVFKKFVFVK